MDLRGRAPQVISATNLAAIDSDREARKQQELPFLIEGDWSRLPTSKVRRPPSGAPFAWAHTYTAFSLDFASAALERLGVKPKSHIIDPFLGSGTTMVAAAIRGCTATGVDISPFSVLLSRARLANAVDRRIVRSYLQNSRSPRSSDRTQHLALAANDLAYAAAVVERICDKRGLEPTNLLGTILSDDVGSYDSEVVSLISLAIGARECAKLTRGSNPIWYRHHSETSRGRRLTLREAARRWSEVVTSDLQHAPPFLRRGNRILNQDFSAIGNQPHKFDVCLTSPPYLNRLDYVVAHLPELSVLQLISPIDLDDLRKKMIGTTKIVEKAPRHAPAEWGDTCRAALDSVANHSSYASQRYYYHTHYHYFHGLYESLKKLPTLMASSCHGLIVVQTSFYKDVRIATPEICTEMLRTLSFRASVIRTTPVRQHMGKMSPTQASYVPQKTLSEALVYFTQ